MRMNRRHFIRLSAGAPTLLAFGSMMPAFLRQSATAAASPRNRRDTVLVVIQLSGGNDGLNTVIPFGDDAYHRARPTLRIPGSQVHKIGAQLGFHPDMTAFARLFKEGRLSVLQGVGYPNLNRSHDAAMRDWHTAMPRDGTVETGWVGRALDAAAGTAGVDVPGAFVGHIKAPLGIHPEQVIVPSLESLDRWALKPGFANQEQLSEALLTAARPSAPQAESPLLNFVRQTTWETVAASRRLQSLAREKLGHGGDRYPQYRLAQTLRTIARLIRADLGVRIYFAELGGGGIGGFDTHAGQAANHGALLRELADSVAAFVSDLGDDKLLDRVTVMTFSEFGRTLTENGRRGTGHGLAAPMFLAGGGVKGGLVGAHPRLDDLEVDAPKFHTDFRRVYATVLENWLGFASEPILKGRFAPIEGVLA